MTSQAEHLRPLTIVGGSEGAGKSSLLRHQLLHGSCRGLAVVVSNLDSLQLEPSDIASRDSTHMTLANGSMCWETNGDVTTTLATMRKHITPQTHVMLEARHDVSLRGVAGYGYTPGYRLDGIVVVADAKSLNGADMEPAALTRMRNHIESAEILVVNKVDLLGDRRPQSLREAIGSPKHNGRAIQTCRGRVPSPLLLGVRPGEAECEDRAMPASWKTSFRPPPRRAATAAAAGDEEEPSYRVWTLATSEPITAHDFRHWVAHLPPTIVRARGYALLADDRPYRYRFDLVGPHHHLQRDTPWGDHAAETRLALVGV